MEKEKRLKELAETLKAIDFFSNRLGVHFNDNGGMEFFISIEKEIMELIKPENQKPFQSEVSKSFQQRLSEKMEKKYSEAEEIRQQLKIEDVL